MQEIVRPVIQSPEAMLFVTIALGVVFGRLRVGGFSFGNAAGTLIVGTAIGALLGAATPALSPTLKSVAFLLFVFAVGFQSGPQFFASLGRSTLPLAAVAVTVAASGLAAVVLIAHLFDLGRGDVIGIAAGALTQTAMLGTAYGALDGLGLPAAVLQQTESQAAVAFAISYVFGTIGVVLFCSQVGPRLIGVDLKLAAEGLAAGNTGGMLEQGTLLDYHTLVARAFRVTAADGVRIADLDAVFAAQAAIQRVRRDRSDLAPSPDLMLRRGDLVAVQGYRPRIVKAASRIGEEVAADALVADLLGDGADVIVDTAHTGMTLREAVSRLGATGRGLFLRRIRRHAHEIPVTAMTVLLPGDVLTLVGPAERLSQALPHIGRKLDHSDRADIAFLAAGLVCGVLIGLLSIKVAGLPLTLSAGGGALVAGLVFGWWHARRPAASNVPVAATQLMWDFGLAAFCALVGLTAGPQAVSALAAGGATLVPAAIIVTLLPQLIGLGVGYFLLKVNPVLLFGALAGSQTQDAAMLAACDVAESPAPALGFTVPYAIGNILLTILGPAVVVLG